MTPIAREWSVSAATICLAWLLAKPVVTSVIIGAKRMDQLRENLAAAEFVLSADEMKKLDEASAIPVEYLEWVVSFASLNRLGGAPRA